MSILDVLQGKERWYVEQGDVLTVLPSMTAPIANVVITSPPYYGFRDYEVPPSVWDGSPECDHDWQPERALRKGNTNGRDGSTLNGKSSPSTLAPGKSNGLDGHSARHIDQSDWCARCGAWRGCLGRERSPQDYIRHLVTVFREVKRVLRPDGSLWLNLGDAYSNDGKWGGRTGGRHRRSLHGSSVGRARRHTGVAPKNLLCIPWRVARALQADGWCLRAACPWVKRSALPEPVRDRPAMALEYIFLLTPGPYYYFDVDAVRRTSPLAASLAPIDALQLSLWESIEESQSGRSSTAGADRPSREALDDDSDGRRHWRNSDPWFDSVDGLIASLRDEARSILDDLAHLVRIRDRGGLVLDAAGIPLGFDVNPAAFRGAHSATYSPDLISPMIRASTSERGRCPLCGAPWQRIVATSPNPSKVTNSAGHAKPDLSGGAARTSNPQTSTSLHRNGSGVYAARRTEDWRPTCGCTVPNSNESPQVATLQPGDLEVVRTPTGKRGHGKGFARSLASSEGLDSTAHFIPVQDADRNHSTLKTGRRGFGRPRRPDEGIRGITRWEQRQIAAQLRSSPYRAEMEQEAGSAFAHYVRTDLTGSRPPPPDLLDAWVARGWVTRVSPPDLRPPDPVPCIVFDPFSGSGRTGVAALKLGRSYIGVELNGSYAEDSRSDLRMSTPHF